MKKFFAVVMLCMMLFSTIAPMSVYAGDTSASADYSDYIAPAERTDNLIANSTNLNLYKAVNTEVVRVTQGATSSEVNYTYIGDGSGGNKWGNFGFYGTEGTWAKSTDGGAGGTSGFNGYYPNGPESFVVEMQIRNVSPTINPNPEFTFSVFTARAEGVAEKQIVPVTATDDWQTVKTIFHTDAESPTSMWIALGYGGATSSVYPAINTCIALYKPSLYVAIEKANDITVTGTTDLVPGGSAELRAQVVNQIGITGNLTQNFTWIALNEDRSEVVEGFSFTEGADGEVTVNVADTVNPGRYVILAAHDDATSVSNGVQKGIDVVVAPYFMTDSEMGEDPLCEVKLTADSDTTLGIFDTLSISAELVDSSGEKGTNAQQFTWYVVDEDRMQKLTDAGINLTPSVDSTSVSVSLSTNVIEGTYYIVAESVADESRGMLKGTKIIIDKSGSVADIVGDITGDAIADIELMLDEYIEILEINEAYVDIADKTELSKILKAGITAEEFEDKQALQTYFKRAALTALYNIPSGSIELFKPDGTHNYEQELAIDKIDDETAGTNLYEKAFAEMSEEGKSAYRASLTGKGFATYGDLYKAILENLLLTTIANPKEEGTGYLDSVITRPNLALVGITANEYFALSETGAKLFKKNYLASKSFTIETLSSTLGGATESGTGAGGQGGVSAGTGGSQGSGGNQGAGSGSQTSGGNKVSFGISGTGSVGTASEEETQDEIILGKEFEDVPKTHWACGEIHYLRNIGVINGITETTYSPDAPVTREQFLKLLIEAFKLGTSNTSTAFSDVDNSAWYAPYVMGGVQKGIINGKSAGEFGVGDSITRQDACVMIDRALSLSGDVSSPLNFKDTEDIADYAIDAVAALSGYGIVNGIGGNEFNPKGICTRAQAAKIIASTLSICNSLGIGR